MKMSIALQLYSVRDELERDYFATLKSVKEMGYDGVELPGLGGRDPKKVKQMLDEVGLKVMSSHVSVAELLCDTENTILKYKQVGCYYIAIPWMSYGESNEKLSENLETIRTLATTAKGLGIQLLYHNHDFEFKTVNDRFILDTIYDEISADLLKTEIDTCWAHFAGVDPAEYVLKYIGRAPKGLYMQQ